MARRLMTITLEPIVPLAVSIDGSAIVAFTVAIEVRMAKVARTRSVEPALASAVLLVAVRRIERTGCAAKGERVVVSEQAEQAKRPGTDGDIAPFVLGPLPMRRLIIA